MSTTRKRSSSLDVQYTPSVGSWRLPNEKKGEGAEKKAAERKPAKDRYFTASAKVDDENQRDLLKEASPFVYPRDIEEFAYKVMSKAWRENLVRKELKLEYNERNNYQSRQQLDVLNRLYVRDPEATSVKTMLDIDPQFFSIVDGRPIREKFKIRDYIENMRKLTRLKIVTGYRQDELELIEQNFAKEQQLIDEVKANYHRYVNAFEEFLYDDHTASMNLLKEKEKQSALADEKYEEYARLSKDFGTLRYMVYNLEEKWRSCKMYQKFLYLVSPVFWRRQHDRLAQNDSGQSLTGEISAVFGRYKLASSGDVLSLEDLVGRFLEDCDTQEDPLLFFDSPAQLLKVFRFIEIQNLNTLLDIEELVIPTENVKEGIKSASYVFDCELQALKELVDGLEESITWEERRAESLERLAKGLVDGDFRRLVAEEDVLNLHVFVEDVYEARVAPNDANLGLGEMMRAVEARYRSLVLRLDTLPQDQVARAEAECFADFERVMRVAREAARRVVQIERLTHGLKRALEPPVHRRVKDLKWRSEPAKVVAPPPQPPRPLTTEESEYLTYFTEYCEKADDLLNYGIDVNRHDESAEDKKSDKKESKVKF